MTIRTKIPIHTTADQATRSIFFSGYRLSPSVDGSGILVDVTEMQTKHLMVA